MTNSDSKKEASILFGMIRKKYGINLTPDELKKVNEGVENIVRAAELLRAVKLDNEIEPFFQFKPYIKDD